MSATTGTRYTCIRSRLGCHRRYTHLMWSKHYRTKDNTYNSRYSNIAAVIRAVLWPPHPLGPYGLRGWGGLLTHFWGVCIYDSSYG